MSSSAKTDSTDFVKSNFEKDLEFSQVVKDGRRILEEELEYKTEQWDWTGDLDDAGIFILSYLCRNCRTKRLAINNNIFLFNSSFI